MKPSLKNLLLQINKQCLIIKKQNTLLCILFFFNSSFFCQIANYVSNGGFEAVTPSATMSPFNAAYYWNSIDTNKTAYYVYALAPTIGNAPYCGTGFQFPRSGNSFILTQLTCSGSMCGPSNSVEYARNRLKQNLQAGKIYCAKYYVVNTNNNRVAMENYGMYFASSSIDTITYCNTPLTYITPQIEYSNGIITDTLTWTCISGTFTALGNEKYMVIGNFHDVANTNTLQLNTPLSTQTADIYIDDVSCIALDLSAYAGPDIWGIPTNTVYLGRQHDVGIDEACMWYKLPNTTTAIDTAAGITITVAAITETYVVKQDICGIIKYDTVVVYPSALGFNNFKARSGELKINPNPAGDYFELSIGDEWKKEIRALYIYNNLGQMMRDERIIFSNNKCVIHTTDLPCGIYILLIDIGNSMISKKLVISK